MHNLSKVGKEPIFEISIINKFQKEVRLTHPSMFNPLSLILVAVAEALFFHQDISLGRYDNFLNNVIFIDYLY